MIEEPEDPAVAHYRLQFRVATLSLMETEVMEQMMKVFIQGSLVRYNCGKGRALGEVQSVGGRGPLSILVKHARTGRPKWIDLKTHDVRKLP